MKTPFAHRRIMAYTALFGLFYLAYGVVEKGLSDGAIGGLAIAFAGIIAAYKVSTTYDDHSKRCNDDNK